MSKSFKPVLISLAILALIVAAGVGFMNSYEKVKERVFIGFKGPAAVNQYYAAMKLMEELGHDTRSLESLHGIPDLPPKEGTLFLTESRDMLGEKRSAELLAWVASGGHLVVTGDRIFVEGADHKDPLLDTLGAKHVEAEFDDDYDDDDDRDEDEEEDAWEDDEDEDVLESIEELEALEELGYADDEVEEERPYNLNADPEQCFDNPEDWSEPDDDWIYVRVPGTREALRVDGYGRLLDAGGRAVWRVSNRKDRTYEFLLQYEHGEGVVTVLGTSYFMNNSRLDEGDHAKFIWRLASWGGRTGAAWFVYGFEAPSLWARIMKYGWMVVLSLLVTLVLWMWSRAARFGPRRVLPDPPRRGLKEHVEATGQFFWRQQRTLDLLDPVRRNVLRKAAARSPDWGQLETKEQYLRIAEMVDWKPKAVEECLSGGEVDHPNRFELKIRTMEKLERLL